ncbi:uncharacterized protein PV06_06924 [Exophiala oligosperma]|uniref:Enoyl reductase (ER) domain-containing protein n=1 Tax=Exophiala oligosperma TaxID=215243 RepID=A0A0D2BV75_9EURO|nr:uncharacterized protein PV06_06924 [Exophiala oligosperma]KIW41357.1 hypothetical protein PV06_06924 [Exophiala oligosperma]
MKGHECCGEVVSVGRKVTKFRPGDMVSVVCVAGCDKPACSECMHGSSHICTSPGVQRYGLGQDGAFAPYIAVRESAAVRVPHGIDAPMAAVATDAVLTAYQAVVGRGKVSADETVLLLGLGGLGFNALQILLHIGARCIAFDKRQLVLDEAVKFGIALDDVIPAETQDIPQWLKDRNVRIDKAIDFVGSPATFSASVEAVRPGGTIVLVGLIGPSPTLNSLLAIRKQLSILCSFAGSTEVLQEVLDLIAQGAIKPQVITRPLSELAQVLDDLHAGKIKSRVALIPGG